MWILPQFISALVHFSARRMLSSFFTRIHGINLFGVQQIFGNKPANGWKVAERDVRVCGTYQQCRCRRRQALQLDTLRTAALHIDGSILAPDS